MLRFRRVWVVITLVVPINGLLIIWRFNKMTCNEEIIGKCAIIEWEQYKKINVDSFVLDEETQLEQLEEVLLEIKKLDNNIKIFVSTYPIEKNEKGIKEFISRVIETP